MANADQGCAVEILQVELVLEQRSPVLSLRDFQALYGLVAERERGVGLSYIRVEDLDDVVEPVLDQKPDRGGVELRGRVDVEKANKLIHRGSAKFGETYGRGRLACARSAVSKSGKYVRSERGIGRAQYQRGNFRRA
jgi:hypothetical protein